MTEDSPKPSPVIESLLTGLGARAEITDAVLGDLHQKLTGIAATEGVRAARRWYRREALRTAPHLLRDGLRSLRLAGGRRLLNVALMSVTVTAMLAAMAFFAGMTLIQAFTGERIAPAEPGGIFALAYVATIVLGAPVFAGFLAATFEEKAPFLAALTVAGGWGALIVLFTARLAQSPRIQLDLGFVDTPLSFIGVAAAHILWVTVGCAVGGLLRVGQGRPVSA